MLRRVLVWPLAGLDEKAQSSTHTHSLLVFFLYRFFGIEEVKEKQEKRKAKKMFFLTNFSFIFFPFLYSIVMLLCERKTQKKKYSGIHFQSTKVRTQIA